MCNPQKRESNFLNVIGKEDDELAFSNWFWYLFNNNKDLLCRFATEVLKLDQPLSHHATIQREIKNIDLLITDLKTNQIIVIENKIKSDINGWTKSRDKDTQSDDSDKDGKTKRYDFDNQLVKYRSIAENEIANDGGFPEGTQANCFIFLPNYSKIDKKIIKQEKYKEIYYSAIRDFIVQELSRFFDKKNDQDGEPQFDYYVLKEFVKALERHTSKYPDYLFEDMQRLFAERISNTDERFE